MELLLIVVALLLVGGAILWARRPSTGRETPAPAEPIEASKKPAAPKRRAPQPDYTALEDAFGSSPEGTTKIDRSALLGIVEAPQARVEEAFFVVIAGEGVGRFIKLERDNYVIGREQSECDIFFHDDAISKQHARVSLRDGAVYIEDLGSSNGTFVDGEEIDSAQLTDGSRVVLGRSTVLTLTFQDELGEQFQQRMYESSTRDQLTDAYNKATFLDRLETEMHFARRHKSNYLVAMMDIDHFKSINDTYGHVAGDEILAGVAKLIRSVTREEAVFARYGGEEFIVAERNASVEDGSKLAERILAAVANYKFQTSAGEIQVTISVGLADLKVLDRPNGKALIEAADRALYQAKHDGRNCFRIATSAQST